VAEVAGCGRPQREARQVRCVKANWDMAGLRNGHTLGQRFSPAARDVRFGTGVGLLGWPTIKCGLLRLKTGGLAACSRQEGGIRAVH